MARLSVLLVEDDATDVAMLMHVLDGVELEIDLHVAGNGVAALQFLDHQRPDLILLDLNMPRMGGQEFLRHLRNRPEIQSLPVLVLTTSSRDEDVAATFLFQADMYITKPDDLEGYKQLVVTLEDYARNHLSL